MYYIFAFVTTFFKNVSLKPDMIDFVNTPAWCT